MKHTKLYLFILVIIIVVCIFLFNRKTERKKAVVFVLTSRAGFFAMFFSMCLAYNWAKENNYDFYIDDNKWQYTYKNGWHDYFDSLKKWDTAEYLNLYDHVEYYDLTSIMVKNGTTMSGEVQNIPNYTTKQYIESIRELFVVKPYLQEKAQLFIQSIGQEYVSLYVRRGDKVVGKHKEMDFHDVETILSKTDIENTKMPIFLQTDDYREYKFLQNRFPERRIYTLTSPEEKGSTNSNMNEWTPEQRKKETENFLISVLVFCNSVHGWTDRRSNVGRFHKLFSFQNVTMYPMPNIRMNQYLTPAWNLEEQTKYGKQTAWEN